MRPLLFSVLLALSASFSAHAETIVLAVPGPGSLVYLPVQLAKAIEADRAEGLTLKLRFFSGGPLAIRDLVENNSDFAVLGLPAIASGRASGMPVVAVGQLTQSAMVILLLRTDLKGKITKISQLEKRRIGVNSSTVKSRSTSQMLTEFLVQRSGVAVNNIEILPAGQRFEEQSNALGSKTVDALMGDEPFASQLVASGQATVLADLYNPQQSRQLLGGTFIHAALATRENVAAEHPEIVAKVQRMFDRTLRWLSQHSASDLVQVLASQPGFNVGDPAILLSVLQRNPGMYPSASAWDKSAVATTEAFFHHQAKNPIESMLKFDDFIRAPFAHP